MSSAILDQGANISFKELFASSQSNFETRAKNYTYVDKTDALEAFLSGGQGIHLLLRARRCGKTMLLTMFRCFFELESDEAIEEKRHLFTDVPLKISKSTLFDKFFAQYPVIYIDLSTMRGASWDAMMINFELIVQREYRRQRKLGRFDGVTDELDTAFIDNVLKLKIDKALPQAFSELSRILFEQTGQKVIVLIDEYDTPVVNAIHTSFLNHVIEFFKAFYVGTLKGNDNLWGALMVGILSIEQTGFFSVFNNVQTFTMNSRMTKSSTDLYSTTALFTEEEVESLYNHYAGKKELKFDLEGLTRWYGGYCTSTGKVLYNPWSVVRALETSILQSCWKPSSIDQVLRDLFFDASESFKGEVDSLLEGRSVRCEIGKNHSIIISKIRDSDLRCILLYAGYLTLDSKGYLKIPNIELKEMIFSWVSGYVSEELTKKKLDRKSAAMFESAVDGPFHIFKSTLSDFIVKHLSFFIFGKDERVHQAFLFGVFLCLGEATFKVTMEEEGGDGRMDIMMVERNGGTRAVIMELKVTKEGRSSPRPLAVAALRQIEDKRYREKLDDEITQLREYGISFRKKKCFVEGRSMVRKAGERWRIQKME